MTAAQDLPEWAQRLISERDEVRDRFNKLTVYMAGDAYKTLPEADKGLLEIQFRTMADYVAILNVRTERLLNTKFT